MSLGDEPLAFPAADADRAAAEEIVLSDAAAEPAALDFTFPVDAAEEGIAAARFPECPPESPYSNTPLAAAPATPKRPAEVLDIEDTPHVVCKVSDGGDMTGLAIGMGLGPPRLSAALTCDARPFVPPLLPAFF